MYIKTLLLTSVIFTFMTFYVFNNVLADNKNINVKTVKNLDLVQYTQYPWYEIASIEQSFERGCVKVRAEYTLLKNNNVKVQNFCLKKNGKESTVVGSAYVPDKSQPSKLKVSFFWPFYADYWVLYVDSEYKFALVGDPNRRYLWILSRYEAISNRTYQKLLGKAGASGYNIEKIRLLNNTIF